jgi:hypothetical protein
MAVVSNNKNAVQQGQQKVKKQQLALWTRGISKLDYTLMQCSIVMSSILFSFKKI